MYRENPDYHNLQERNQISGAQKLARGQPNIQTVFSQQNQGKGAKDLLGYKFSADFKYKDLTKKPNQGDVEELRKVREASISS